VATIESANAQTIIFIKVALPSFYRSGAAGMARARPELQDVSDAVSLSRH
jgi:hypothetical protein